MPIRLALILLAVFAFAAGCVQSNASRCGSLTCPGGTTCGPAGDRCVDNDLVDACRGANDGDTCTVPGLPPAQCQGGVCQASRCGDGRVSGSEECDGVDFDGRTCQTLGFYEPTGLACTSECRYEMSACAGRCGDGVKNGPEKCDGGDLGNATCFDAGFYAAPGIACASDCSFDTSSCGGGSCGDGIVNGFEQCDLASLGIAGCAELGYLGALSNLACSRTCTYSPQSCQCATGRCRPNVERCECGKFGCGCVPN